MASRRNPRNRRSKKSRRNGRRRLQRGGAEMKSSTLFDQAYAVSLPEKFPERVKRMTEFAEGAGMPLKFWEGVVITPEQKDTLPELGVGTTHYKDRTGATFNLGVIGAFLAHRNLMENLANTAPNSPGTIIFEDDVVISTDFYEKLKPIEKEVAEFASDWDLLFLDKFNVDNAGLKKVSEHVYKLPKDMTAMKNWGMWAFIVKNASIKDRVLPTMEHMLDVPDIQLNKFADKLNMYLVIPSLITLDQKTAATSAVSILDVQKPNA